MRALGVGCLLLWVGVVVANAVNVVDGNEGVDAASFLAVATEQRLGVDAHLAEHASVASRVHAAAAAAAAVDEQSLSATEAQAASELESLRALERDPRVAEVDKLVARLSHATRSIAAPGGAPHFFADRFYLESLRAQRNASPRLVQVLDALADGVDNAEADEDAESADAQADAEAAVSAAADAHIEHVEAGAASAESESDSAQEGLDAQFEAVLNAFESGDLDAAADLAASDLAVFEADAEADAAGDSQHQTAAELFDDLRFRAREARAIKPRPKAVPKSASDDAAKRPDLRGRTRRDRKHRGGKHRKHGRGRRPNKKARAAAKRAAAKRAALEKRAGQARSKLAAKAVAALTAAKGQAVPSAESFRALLARKNTPGYSAPSETMCDVGSIVRTIESFHERKYPALRKSKPSAVGRKRGFTAAHALAMDGLSASATEAAVEDGLLNEIIDAVEDWFLHRLPLLDLHIATHSAQAGCKNLNVQAISLLKIIALNRLGVAKRVPVGSPSGLEEMICRLRGQALWQWFDRHMSRSKPVGAGDKWLIELEGKLRFGTDHIGTTDPALTLMFLALRQLGPQYRGRLVVRLLTLPGITYDGIAPERRAIVQAESERVLSPLFSNLRVAARFLLHKVYFAILSSQKHLTELLPNLEGVKVGNLRSRTWASVRGVGGATGYFSKGKLVVPPLQAGWTQKVIPAVPEQTLQTPPNGLKPTDALPEGWIKLPKEDGGEGVEYYHELYPPLVEFTDGNQTLEGYERPVQCDPPYCAALQMAVFPEENLLNNETLVPPKLLDDVEHGYAQGYSIATHEMAHCVDMNGLHSKQHSLLNDEYERKMRVNAIFTDGYRDPKKRITRGCYASHTVYEYFAQLTNTWLGTNHGLDPHFSLCSGPSRCKKVMPNDLAGCAAIAGCDSEHFPRANTQQWVVSHESPAITNLLWSLYGRTRLVSFPVVLSAGFGYVYSPELARKVAFAGGYFEIDKTRKAMAIYKSQHIPGAPRPQKPALVVPLRGAGNAIWEESAGPKALWRRRPNDELECVVLTTVHKRHYYLCQRDIEQLLTALNEAIFLA